MCRNCPNTVVEDTTSSSCAYIQNARTQFPLAFASLDQHTSNIRSERASSGDSASTASGKRERKKNRANQGIEKKSLRIDVCLTPTANEQLNQLVEYLEDILPITKCRCKAKPNSEGKCLGPNCKIGANIAIEWISENGVLKLVERLIANTHASCSNNQERSSSGDTSSSRVNCTKLEKQVETLEKEIDRLKKSELVPVNKILSDKIFIASKSTSLTKPQQKQIAGQLRPTLRSALGVDSPFERSRKLNLRQLEEHTVKLVEDIRSYQAERTSLASRQRAEGYSEEAET